jgi:hypothetical protein
MQRYLNRPAVGADDIECQLVKELKRGRQRKAIA